MGYRGVTFALLLYVCLAWVSALYLYPDEYLNKGLFYTIVGLLIALALVVGGWALGWIRLLRARRASKPVQKAQPVAPERHPDDLLLARLLQEAAAKLMAERAEFSGRSMDDVWRGVPVYLVIGAPGSGKTSAVQQADIGALLIAGQAKAASPTPGPTPVANIWFANGSLIIEIGGQQFTQNIDRWTELLKVLTESRPLPWWRQFRRKLHCRLEIQALVYMVDVSVFLGRSDPAAVESQARAASERLSAICRTLGVALPVYTVFTKTDQVPYFADYFARFPEPDAAQPLGGMLPVAKGEVAEPDNAELLRVFNDVYISLANLRTLVLNQDVDPPKKARIYQFPREFRRMRQAMVDFLGGVMQQRDLKHGLLARGYFFSGRREVEVSGHPNAATDWNATISPATAVGGATQFFSQEQIDRILRENNTRSADPLSASRRELRWMFLADLFTRVVASDRPLGYRIPTHFSAISPRVRIASACVIAVCAFLGAAWLVSSVNNYRLLRGVSVSSAALRPLSEMPADQQWTSLDSLRVELAALASHDRNRVPWRLDFGLYAGTEPFAAGRVTYVRRLRSMALNQAHARIVRDLESLPADPPPEAPYDGPADYLKAHVVLSKGTCSVPPPALAATLHKAVQREGGPDTAILRRQVDFFAEEVTHGNPVPFDEAPQAREQARRYLSRLRGIDRIYSALISGVERQVGEGAKLTRLSADYARVLRGPDQMRAVFSPTGWTAVKSALSSGTIKVEQDPCFGENANADWKQTADLRRQLEERYARDYIEAWKQHLNQFSIVKYGSAADAARKLEHLDAYNSPLLALFALTSAGTSMPPEPASKIADLPVIGKALKDFSKKPAAKKALELTKDDEASLTVTDITKAFQPMHAIVPPGSEKWLNEQNTAYLESLAGLQKAIAAIGASRADPPDAALHKAGEEAFLKAQDSVRQVARNFSQYAEGAPIAERLLREPIDNARPYIRFNYDPAEGQRGKVNAEMKAFCRELQPALSKYPLNSSSPADLSLSELTTFFAPSAGKVWAFQNQTLKFIAKEGRTWKPNPATPDMKPTESLLLFMNKAQQISDAFFANGSPQPSLSIEVRPELSSSSEQVIVLNIHGQAITFSKSAKLRETISWPPPSNAPELVSGRTGAAGLTAAFSVHQGPWALFRLLGDADDRPVLQRSLVWTATRGRTGERAEPLDVPVRLNIIEFPGGVDVFNKKSFSGLRCPAEAVQ